MKTHKIALILLILLITGKLFPQTLKLPEIELFTLDGISVKASEISNDKKPMIVVFWDANSLEGCNQLLMINDLYEENLKDSGVKVVAVCEDSKGEMQQIKPYVLGHNIDFEVYVDKNGDFKRAMNFSDLTVTTLYDTNMNVYCRYLGCCYDGGYHICEKIKKCQADSE